ncbi:MAG TPA: biopolymer transporter ExbD [Rhodocyclaceae bacterium]
MDFRRARGRDEPEINLIPMIDVLLVILIFLMITTTYSKFSGMEINLPTADATVKDQLPNEIDVVVSAEGQVMVNRAPVTSGNAERLAEALRRAAGTRKDPVIVINADAKASHQSVVDVMQAAQIAGYPHISFAIQSPR